MKAIIPLLSIVLTGCFSSMDQEPIYKVDPKLNTYVDSFFNLSDSLGRHLNRENITVQLRSGLEDMGDWGLSTKMGDQRIVYIDQDFFDFYIKTNHPDRIEALVFHELGHALLLRKHTNEYSIMNVNIPLGYKDKSVRDILIAELFKL